MNNVLLIDDDKKFHISFEQSVSGDDIHVYTAVNSEAAREILNNESIQMIFLDLDLGSEHGLDILPTLTPRHIPVCILSGTATINVTVEALKKGAVDVVEKPVSRTDVIRRIQLYASATRDVASEPQWTSERMREVEQLVTQIAPTSAKVLLRGETGTGKEVMARRIHELSPRSGNAFVAVNCGSIPENLIENELFGSKKGAFTGADRDYIGLIQQADGGSLFLDEIAELPLPAQVKLLRFLQEGEVRPLGSDRTETVDVRVIAATHKDLESMVQAGTFREDLYFRLNVFMIDIPALRERTADIPVLIDELVERFRMAYKNQLVFKPETIRHLQRHAWRGNIRELSNLIERLMLTVHHPVRVDDLPAAYQAARDIQPPIEASSLKEAREAFERQYIERLLAESDSLKTVSERLKIERTTLYKKMKALGIRVSDSES